MSHTYRTRLPSDLAAQLQTFCRASKLPTSAVLREALRYFLQHPLARVEVFDDPRTEAQKVAWAQVEATLGQINVEQLMDEAPGGIDRPSTGTTGLSLCVSSGRGMVPDRCLNYLLRQRLQIATGGAPCPTCGCPPARR
jgi:hypothetical protein